MSITCGIVGLPNVGKSSLFNALTASKAEIANYPFCTIEPNVSIVPVPDRRLDSLRVIYKPEKVTPTILEFFDIAGLVKGASRGEGLGNQFLHHIRDVNALLHVVRCFKDDNIMHIDGSVDPKRDIETVETELILKDLETVEKRIERTAKRAKSGDKKLKEEVSYCESIRSHLSGGRMASYYQTEGIERELLNELHLLTSKPVMYVANVDEDEYLRGNGTVNIIREIAEKEGAAVVTVCSKLEAEIAGLHPREQKSFLAALGIEEPGLHKVIREAYSLLNLLTFFTCGPKEVRAWSVKRGENAYEAAGEIHTDFQRGFIRAEIVKTDDIIRYGSEVAVKERGLMALQGKEYIVEDGDIIFFRFNV